MFELLININILQAHIHRVQYCHRAMVIQEKNSAKSSIDYEEPVMDLIWPEDDTEDLLDTNKNHTPQTTEITIISSSNDESNANDETDGSDAYLMDVDDLSDEELDDLLSEETPTQDIQQQNEEVEEKIIDTSNNDESSKEVKDSLRWYLCMVNQYKPLRSREEEQELFIRMHQGDEEAREEIFNRNLKLVVDISKKYWWFGPSPLDVIQEGNLGLLKAMNMFDYQLGYKFSTYAYNWIVQRITRYFSDYGRFIRLPVHLWEKINVVQKAKTKFYDNLHREPTANELAEELKCKVSTIERLLILDSPIISLDSLFSYSDLVDFRLVPPNPVLENDKSAKYYLGDYYYNESETDEFCARIDQKDMIKKLFTHLNEKQADVLIRRYGLDKRPEETLEQIGLKYNVTRERIRQIEDRALKKLRLHIKAHQ